MLTTPGSRYLVTGTAVQWASATCLARTSCEDAFVRVNTTIMGLRGNEMRDLDNFQLKDVGMHEKGTITRFSLPMLRRSLDS